MQKRTGWILLGFAFVGPIIGFLMACVVTYVMPKKYESEAIIEVKPLEGLSPPAAMTPQFFGTQFEMIRNHDSLAKVADRLELVNKWSVDKETAIRILKGIVNTQNIRGTDLISIKVRHTNKEDARDVTSEVARVYREYRIGISKTDEESRLVELNKAVKEQENKVAERSKLLNGLGVSKGLMTQPDSLGMNDRNKNALSEQDYVDAKRDLETDQALLQQMKLKQLEKIMNSKMTTESVVVHEDPQIAEFPVSPNVTLNLVLGAVIGFILSPLMALPLVILLNRLNPVRLDVPSVHPG